MNNHNTNCGLNNKNVTGAVCSCGQMMTATINIDGKIYSVAADKNIPNIKEYLTLELNRTVCESLKEKIIIK